MEQGPEDTSGDSRVAQLRINQRIEAREARVAGLRRRILDGTYYIDPAKLSAKIIDHHRQ